jgi:Leucine-rich repeat (LRR) protein
MTPEWVAEAISKSKQHHPARLNLSGIDKEPKLAEIPLEVFELERLVTLELGNNNLSEVPESVTQLANLKVLDLIPIRRKGEL